MDLRPKNARILKQLFYKNVETSHIPAVHPYSCIIYTLLNKDNQIFMHLHGVALKHGNNYIFVCHGIWVNLGKPWKYLTLPSWCSHHNPKCVAYVGCLQDYKRCLHPNSLSMSEDWEFLHILELGLILFHILRVTASGILGVLLSMALYNDAFLFIYSIFLKRLYMR